MRYGEVTPAKTEARKKRRTLQVSVIVEDSLKGLSPAARHVLELAALLPPDRIVLDWLRRAAAKQYPELLSCWTPPRNELNSAASPC